VPSPRSQADDVLAPGDVLVLYTDGLVERRGRDLDEGLRALADAAYGSLVGVDDLEAACDALVDALTPESGREDDTAVVVVRRD
jgi:serine phosphatase RsbU (regulator of sigma subunit)